MASLVTARARALIQHLATGVQMRKSLRSSAEPPSQRSNTAAALKTTEAAASTSSSISTRLARSRGRAAEQLPHGCGGGQGPREERPAEGRGAAGVDDGLEERPPHDSRGAQR